MIGFDEGVWKIVLELGQQERHFNQMQHQYRLLASSWLLAMFAGIGFSLSQANFAVPAEFAVAVIGLAGALGLTQLWSLDLRVYHQLLDGCFVQGLDLEVAHPWLPQARLAMMQSQDDSPAAPGPAAQRPLPAATQTRPSRPAGVLARVVSFYIMGTSVALLASFAGMAAAAGKKTADPGMALSAVAAVAVLVTCAWNYEMYRSTQSPLLDAWLRRRR
jgi:hypothetical protein